MGRSGIRRRKAAHHLPKVEDEVTDAEAMRVFGNFRWNAYSPAGSLERTNFLIRQAARRRRHPEWRGDNRGIVHAGHVLIAVAYGALALAISFAVVDRLLGGR